MDGDLKKGGGSIYFVVQKVKLLAMKKSYLFVLVKFLGSSSRMFMLCNFFSLAQEMVVMLHIA